MPLNDEMSQRQKDESGSDYGRTYNCGDFCSFNIFKIPGLILRNIIFPRDMWDDLPDGFDRIADRFVFQPDTARAVVPTPESFDIVDDYEEITIQTKDNVKLHSYLIKSGSRANNAPITITDDSENETLDTNKNEVENVSSTSPPSSATAVPTIIYFHGNAGNIGYCLDVVKMYKSHAELSVCNWLLVEYRGYGKSEGLQSEKGVYADAKAALTYVDSREDLNSEKIILMGHSLGGAVAIHLASHSRYRKKVAGLILENTFTSIPQLARRIMDMTILNYLPSCFYSCKFGSIDKVSKVKCPTLFLCSRYDDIVPNDMSETLYNKCGAKVKFMEKLQDGGHNDAYTSDDYLPKVAAFIKNHICGESTSVTGQSQLVETPADLNNNNDATVTSPIKFESL